MTFGERIRHRRKVLNMTRDELAALTGISYSQLARYEGDESQATGDAITTLAHTLRVSADWLLGITEAVSLDSLTDLEQEAVSLIRTKSPESQMVIVEVLRSMVRL